MLLLVGLGNPGARYEANRHNIGFKVLDAVARHHRIEPWRRGFHGLVADGQINADRVLLLKPQTYMNDSGRSVGDAAHFFKLSPADIIVFHDEVDLPPGKLRVKTGGGNAGHNGLRSISAHIGNDYRRVRIGIGHPGIREIVQHYVLADFAKDERPWVEGLCQAVADNAGLLVRGEDASFQNKIHLALSSKGLLAPKPSDKPPED